MALVETLIILRKDQIKSILPHRGRMLLLDTVKISDEEVIGEFTVTDEVCEGHCFNGEGIFRGSDFYDMASQLLGVWACQSLNLLEGVAFVRTYGEAKFIGRVGPCNELIMKVNKNNLKIETIKRSDGVLKIFGSCFGVKVDGCLKVKISSVELIHYPTS